MTTDQTWALGSQSVDWWAVAEFVEPMLSAVGSWPTAGTVAWIQLDDGDPRKLAALFDAARHHALRVDGAQEALAAASKDVSAAADWAAVSRGMFHRDNGIYIPRNVA